MRPWIATTLALAALLAAHPAATQQGEVTTDVPEHVAADASAPPVTAASLLESERFWPYQVALVRAWRPPGAAQALPAGTRGVLIRVEATGRARVDFGRQGLYEVAVGDLDLVAE